MSTCVIVTIFFKKRTSFRWALERRKLAALIIHPKKPGMQIYEFWVIVKDLPIGLSRVGNNGYKSGIPMTVELNPKPGHSWPGWSNPND